MSEFKEKKPWYKRWWTIILFIIIGMGVLGNIFGGSPSTTNNSDVINNSKCP
ncbi:MAG: hypothetical protein KAK00_03905 [Nanoarchaeota archaeon]|nr:hypothetical protein [Nanoarchaeota archaeon]